MQNTGRFNLAPEHTLQTPPLEIKQPGLSDVTDIGREILANIESDDNNKLRIERSRIEFDDEDADDLERDIGMLQRPSKNQRLSFNLQKKEKNLNSTGKLDQSQPELEEENPFEQKNLDDIVFMPAYEDNE